MRTFSFFDGELYCEIEDIEGSDYDVVGKLIEDEIYQNREYEFVHADKGILAEYSGIRSMSGLGDALKNLEKNCLIEPLGYYDGYDTWKIYRIPPRYFPASLLNDAVNKRYGNTETVNSNL
jgi:hypothetical protein